MGNPLLESALALAAKGYRVFPCAGGSKVPIAGGHGFHDATVDETQLCEWWTSEENANVALSCSASGVVAIDVDPRHGGEATMARLFEELGGLPETVESATGGPDGGRHLIFRAPQGPLVGGLGPGVDVKHEGYILVEPSVHPSGGVYRWIRSPLEVEPAELPDTWSLAPDRELPRPATRPA